MKFFKIKVVCLIILSSSTLLNAKCTQEESFNMMLALQQVGQQYMEKYESMSDENPKRSTLTKELTGFQTEVSEVGILLKDEKYSEACETYEKIASKYKINLKEVMKTSPTIASLEQQGKDGKCTMSDASIKYMNLTSAAPKLESKEKKTMQKIRNSIVSNPALSCEESDKLIAKYSIKMDEPK